MLRKDRERDAAFAWEVFQKAPYATLSLTDEVGKPYAIPISPVVDEAYHVVYFHCAGHGEKWELLAKKPAGMPVGSLLCGGHPQRVLHGLCLGGASWPCGGGHR
mgnify:FL=1